MNRNNGYSLAHTVFDCKYHIVFCPKRRRKVLFSNLKSWLGKVFRDLATRYGCEIIEGHICTDHVHMLIMIPPKIAVAQAVGFIKGKSAIAISREWFGRERNFTGESFWARGYYVSTVGRDEEKIREYVRNQEKEEARLEQLSFFDDSSKMS